jgi:drug/metabolite transporter (DMT)-like permease
LLIAISSPDAIPRRKKSCIMSSETDALLSGQQRKVLGKGDIEDDVAAREEREAFEAAKSSGTAATTIASSRRQQVVSDVQEALKDHMEEALEGNDFFLTMSLTKNLSLLPSKPELKQAVEEMQEEMGELVSTLSSFRHRISHRPQQQQQQEEEDYDETKSPPLKAYLILASAVCALSSIGPCLAKQVDCDATMKIVWRFQGTVVLLSPLAIHSMWVDGIPKLSMAQWLTFFTAATSYSVLCVAFAMSVDYTTVANALILTNSQSVLLVAAKLLMGQHVIFLEAIGVAIAFLGGVLAAREAAGDDDAPAQGWWSVYGDFLGLVSSVGGIGYIVLGKSLRAHFPVLLFMWMNMFTASFICILWMYLLGKEVSWDLNYHHGVFGWMLPVYQRLPLEIITVVVCNVFGTLGYVRAFKYFSSVIIAVAALVEPVVGAFTATAWGVGSLPGVEGWIGNFLVIVGTMAVLYPTTPQYQAEQKRKQKLQEAQQATPRTPFPRMRTPRLQRHPNRRDRMPGADGHGKDDQDNDAAATQRRLQNLKNAAAANRSNQSHMHSVR